MLADGCTPYASAGALAPLGNDTRRDQRKQRQRRQRNARRLNQRAMGRRSHEPHRAVDALDVGLNPVGPTAQRRARHEAKERQDEQKYHGARGGRRDYEHRASHLFFLRRVRSRRAAAGYRRQAAAVEAFEAVSAMGSKNLRPRRWSRAQGAGRAAGTHLALR